VESFVVKNVSQFLPEFDYYIDLGKYYRANFLLQKALIEIFGHCVRIWYDPLHEAVLVFHADFGA
jgi:hypothetical protein